MITYEAVLIMSLHNPNFDLCNRGKHNEKSLAVSRCSRNGELLFINSMEFIELAKTIKV
jgi:hypothetical protein